MSSAPRAIRCWRSSGSQSDFAGFVETVEGDRGASQLADFGAEAGDADLAAVTEFLPRKARELGEDGLEHEVAGVEGGGAEDDHLRVEGDHADADALGEAQADFIPHFDSQGNAEFGAFADRLEVEVFELALDIGQAVHGVVGAEAEFVLQLQGAAAAAAEGFEAAGWSLPPATMPPPTPVLMVR